MGTKTRAWQTYRLGGSGGGAPVNTPSLVNKTCYQRSWSNATIINTSLQSDQSLPIAPLSHHGFVAQETSAASLHLHRRNIVKKQNRSTSLRQDDITNCYGKPKKKKKNCSPYYKTPTPNPPPSISSVGVGSKLEAVRCRGQIRPSPPFPVPPIPCGRS